MGSFAVACSVSGIAINVGEPIVYFPLEKSKYRDYHLDDKNIFLIYPECFYSPACFALKGKYDDYGGIEDIEKNDTTKFIEAWYERPVEKIWDCREEENKTPENIVSGMFVAREVYDMLLENHIDDLGRTVTMTKRGLVAECERVQIDLKEKEKTDQYLTIRQRNEFISILNPSPVIFRGLHTVSMMAIDCIRKGILFEELADMVMFHWGMTELNSFYFPAASGRQFGNNYMNRKLNMLIAGILNERITIAERDREEWEEDERQI